MIAAIWAEVLGRERVGATDDFFDLGGHSLIATQVAARLRERCEVVLPLRTLFEQTTVETLAATVRTARASGAPLASKGVLRRTNRERRRVVLDTEGEIDAVKTGKGEL